MAETVTSEPMPRGTAELKAAIQRIFEQMEEADERIRRHHAEIDRLRAETRVILDQLKAELGT